MTSAGEQLRLDGQDAALAAATVGHHDHPNRIETALTELIRSGREFSADHVRDLVPPETRDWMTDHYNVLPHSSATTPAEDTSTTSAGAHPPAEPATTTPTAHGKGAA